ncbi:FAD binding domain of DNA photolyase-domain-containing protein [Xylaria grammica]|nr:FAD binding domain of DNA photolyase-domain-containing protein [Xylaria grammica]
MGQSKKHERSASSDLLKHPSTKRVKEVDTTDSPYKKPTQRLDAHSSSSKVKSRNKARENGSVLLTCFLYSPEDLKWHGTSPGRSDLMFERLRLVQEQFEGLNIPRVILTAEERGQKGEKMTEFVPKHNVSHVYANHEYEVNELRRDLDFLNRVEAGRNLQFELHHDQTVVKPGTLRTGSGGPHEVFTPYHKLWLITVSEDPSPFNMVGLLEANDKGAQQKSQELFDTPKKTFPSLSKDKLFPSNKDRDRICGLWPTGHEACIKRLREFLHKKCDTYAKNGSIPAGDNSSRTSPYFAAGVVSIRQVLSTSLKERNNGSADFSSSGADVGLASWVREIVFHGFYRHMMAVAPHNGMNLLWNLKFDFGTTGVTFVDAGITLQLRREAYMHNRLRANASSYLRTNLLLDYRRGERWFGENLVDWDPSYTVFNPISQAEKCDPHGDYIRTYVPGLKDTKGEAIFDLFNCLDKGGFK